MSQRALRFDQFEISHGCRKASTTYRSSGATADRHDPPPTGEPGDIQGDDRTLPESEDDARALAGSKGPVARERRGPNGVLVPVGRGDGETIG